MRNAPLSLSVILLIGISAISAQAQPANSEAKSPGQKAMHEQIAASMSQQFDRDDKNHDGFLTFDEWQAATAGDSDFAGAERSTFDKVDTNRDQRITKQEATNWMTAVLSCFDGDGDGVIADEEMAMNSDRCMVAAGFRPRQAKR